MQSPPEIVAALSQPLFRVRGAAKFVIKNDAEGSGAVKAAQALRRWREEYECDAELSTAWTEGTKWSEGDLILDLHLHLNDIKCADNARALAIGMTQLTQRCRKVGYELKDAIEFGLSAELQKEKAHVPA